MLLRPRGAAGTVAVALMSLPADHILQVPRCSRAPREDGSWLRGEPDLVSRNEKDAAETVCENAIKQSLKLIQAVSKVPES
jgi:hypothetical protein